MKRYIARRVSKPNFDTMLDLLDESNPEARALFHGYYNDEIIDRLMQHPAAIFASDSWQKGTFAQCEAPESSWCRKDRLYGKKPRKFRA